MFLFSAWLVSLLSLPTLSVPHSLLAVFLSILVCLPVSLPLSLLVVSFTFVVCLSVCLSLSLSLSLFLSLYTCMSHYFDWGHWTIFALKCNRTLYNRYKCLLSILLPIAVTTCFNLSPCIFLSPSLLNLLLQVDLVDWVYRTHLDHEDNYQQF